MAASQSGLSVPPPGKPARRHPSPVLPSSSTPALSDCRAVYTLTPARRAGMLVRFPVSPFFPEKGWDWGGGGGGLDSWSPATTPKLGKS